MRRFIYRIISLGIICASLFLVYRSQLVDVYQINNMFLLPSNSVANYVALSDNIYNCNLSAVSNIFNNMLKDGYSIQRIELNEAYIDFVLSNGVMQHRVHYLQNGECAAISNPYEKSNIPFTYINER